MIEAALALTSALWLGILTSISPCPLATNVAAISYIGRRVGSTREVLAAGLLYTFGRMAAYLGLTLALTFTALSVSQVAGGLQQFMSLALGPVLILIGMMLLGLIQLNFGGGGISEAMQKRVEAMGLWGALLLGVLFALAFCPLSAGLFFGNVWASIQSGSPVLVPLMYGVGTALPVILFAGLIAYSAQSVGTAFNALKQIEWWARMATGAVFLLIGLFFALRYIFEVI